MADFPKLPRIRQDDENMEKMHCAARRGQVELIRRLVSTGVDPHIQNKFGCTALHVACKYGHLSCVKELGGKGDLTALWHGQKPLVLAVQSGKPEVVSCLVEHAKSQGKDIPHFLEAVDEYEVFTMNNQPKHIVGQTALHAAIMNKDHEMIKLLISLGATHAHKDSNKETCLMRCIEFNFEEEFDLLLKKCPPSAVRLESCDKGGRSPLHWALQYNRVSMAKKLIDLGHECYLEDNDGNIPVIMAALGAHPTLLEPMLANVDPFLFQRDPGIYSNTTQQIQIDATKWNPHADPVNQMEVTKILQKKMDTVNKQASQQKGADKHGKGSSQMYVAPSAPVKK